MLCRPSRNPDDTACSDYPTLFTFFTTPIPKSTLFPSASPINYFPPIHNIPSKMNQLIIESSNCSNFILPSFLNPVPVPFAVALAVLNYLNILTSFSNLLTLFSKHTVLDNWSYFPYLIFLFFLFYFLSNII